MSSLKDLYFPAPAQIYRMFPWSNPKFIVTRTGKALALMTTEPNQQFWGMWRSAKASMKRAGVSVKLEKDEWKVNWWCEFDTYYSLNALNGRRDKIDVTGLLSFQHEHVANLVAALKHYGAVLDGSQTGAGKTICALITAREMGIKPLVVCPKSVIPNWKRWSERLDVQILDAVGYEKLKFGNTQYVIKNGDTFDWNLSDHTIIIFDEVHRTGGRLIKNVSGNRKWTRESELLASAASEGRFNLLLLSATLADRTLRMSAPGMALRLFSDRKDFYSWGHGFGCGYRQQRVRGGKIIRVYDFVGGERDMLRLHECVYGTGRGFRLRAEDIDGFPDGQIQADLIGLEGAEKAYLEIRRVIAEANDDDDHVLRNLTRVRIAAELAKVDEAVQRGRDLLEEGCSVVYFVNFREVGDRIAAEFEGACRIDGDQTAAERAENIRKFQENESHVIICQYQAGGVGVDLHDLHGRRRVCIGMPTWNSLLFKQALGRTRRVGSLSPSLFIVLFADCWPERQIWENVQRKVMNIDALNDGDLALPRAA